MSPEIVNWNGGYMDSITLTFLHVKYLTLGKLKQECYRLKEVS